MSIGIARRIASALGIKSETDIRRLNEALLEYVRLTSQSAATALPGNIAASQVVSGTFADARIAASNVTQHEAALTILAAQIDGTALGNFANDAAAATGGVSVGEFYRNGSIVMVRVA